MKELLKSPFRLTAPPANLSLLQNPNSESSVHNFAANAKYERFVEHLLLQKLLVSLALIRTPNSPSGGVIT